ncbi:MAG: GNAT family N-acetyltransferase [Opitutales bacterium]|jgi:ribosomal protein S18 acetylase RimI-like enzyme|nr:GNAT family N-acetyltransferase [Opitutales bacterium]
MAESNSGMTTLRLATASDWRGLASLHHFSHSESFKPYASQKWLTSRVLSDYEKDWEERVFDESISTWVTATDTCIAGMVSLKPDATFQSEDDLGPVAYLEGMHVHRDFMRQGLGRKLIRQALAHARTEGYFAVYLHVMKLNQPAYELFRSEGWISREEIPKGLEGVPIVLCRCEL